MASENTPTPAEAEFIAVVETGPLTEVEVVEAPDGGLIVRAVAVDPDTADEVPVSIALDPDGAALVVTVASEETVVTRDDSSEDASSKNSKLIRPLRKLHELATRLEQEAKGKAREVAERLRLKRNG
jgi:hypothetical protein